MTVLEFPAKLVEGRLPRPVAEQLALALRQAWDKHVVVTVKEVKRVRGSKANAYYWSCVIPPITALFRDAGNTVDAEDTHLYLKLHVGKLRQVVVTPDGEVRHIVRSTTKLTTREFADYLEKCIAFAAEHGVTIPPADPFHDSTTNKETTP